MYSLSDINLVAAYLFDQGERNLRVYTELLWKEPEIGMEEVEKRVEKYRKTKEYADLYSKFAEQYDNVLKRNPMAFVHNERLSDEYFTARYFYVAGERRIPPEKIARSISMAGLYKAKFFQDRFGGDLSLLGSDNRMKPWERLVADTVYFDAKHNYEIEKLRTDLYIKKESEGTPEAAISKGDALIKARENLERISNNYMAGIGSYPPLETAISKIFGLSKDYINKNFIIETIMEYKNDGFSIASIIDYLRSQDAEKTDKDEDAVLIPSNELRGYLFEGIGTVLATTAYFQETVGKMFEHVKPAVLDERTIAISDAYLESVDSEIGRLEQKVAMNEMHINVSSDSYYAQMIEEDKSRLTKLYEISKIGHSVMDQINDNLSLRYSYEQQAIKEKDSDSLKGDVSETLELLRSDYFKNVYGYQLEKLYGRELTLGDYYVLNKYREFLFNHVGVLEDKVKGIASAEQVGMNEFRKLWKDYVTNLKLLECIDSQWSRYVSKMHFPGFVVPEIVLRDKQQYLDMQNQYSKYIGDIKYDIAHPEFVGILQTDENYWERENLIKKVGGGKGSSEAEPSATIQDDINSKYEHKR